MSDLATAYAIGAAVGAIVGTVVYAYASRHAWPLPQRVIMAAALSACATGLIVGAVLG